MKHLWLFFALIFSCLTVIGADDEALSCNDEQFYNGTACVCLAYYDGGDCKNINCLNGGFLLVNGSEVCHCPVGYYGQYCETYQESPAQPTLFQVKSPNLIHFVNTDMYFYENPWSNYSSSIQQDPAVINSVYQNYYLYGLRGQNSSNNQTGPISKQVFFNTINDPKFVNNISTYNVEPDLFKPLLDFIKANKFSQTSINLFTMFPGIADNLDALVATAVAFQIRINVYIGRNSILPFTDDDFQILRKLAFVTGGTYFGFTLHDTDAAMYPKVMGLNANAQLVAYKEVVKGNDTLTINLVSPFIFETYYVFVNGPSLNYSRSDCLVKALGSTPTDLYMLQLYSVFVLNSNCALSLRGNGARYIQAFGSGYESGDLLGVMTYATFTDAQNIDTGYIGMKDHIPLYIRLHIETRSVQVTQTYQALSVTYENELGQQLNATSVFVKRDVATFEFVSDKPIACIGHDDLTNTVSNHWLTIQFNTTVDRGTFTESRYIPVKCYSDYHPPSTTTTVVTTTSTSTVPPTTTTTTESTTTAETVTTESTESTTTQTTTTQTTTTQTTTTTTTPIPGSECFPLSDYKSNLPSMVLGLSVYYPLIVRNALLTGIFGLNKTFAESNYYSFTGLLFDYDSFDYGTAKVASKSYDNFTNGVHSLAYKNSYVPSSKTNVLDVLLGILQDPNVGPNSAVTLLVSSLKFDDTPANADNKIKVLQLATTKQIKINLFMDLKYYPTEAVHDFAASVYFAYYEQLTAVTDGHFLITTANSIVPQNGTYLLANYFASLYKNAFNNKLALSYVFSKNAIDLKHEIKHMGIVDLTGLTGVRSLYFSAFFAGIPSENGFKALLVITNMDNSSVHPESVTINPGSGNFLSNFNSEIIPVNLPAGFRYEFRIMFTFSQFTLDGTTVGVRFWQTREDQDHASYDISYLDVKPGTPGISPLPFGPRWDTMATAKITLNNFPSENIANITVDFFDCNGRFVPQFDNYNYATVFNDTGCATEFYVNPFLCEHAQNCQDDAHQILYGFYTMNITLTDTNGAKRQQTAHFWCDKPVEPAACPTDKPFTTTTMLSTTTTIVSTTITTTASTTTTTTPFLPQSRACPCLSIKAPHQRGPLCTVPDCSRNGYLVYNDTAVNYNCYCLNGYSGTYCEEAECTEKPYKTTLDVNYRTLTIAIIYKNRNELANILTSIGKLDDGSLDTIYHFNVFASCAGSPSQTIYFGTSKTYFKDAITNTNNYASTQNLTLNCGTDVEFNLTDFVSYGLKPLGKEVRGLFWLATHDSDAIYFDKPGNDTDDLLTFYTLIQGYKQEIFITSVTSTNYIDDIYYSYYNTIAAVRVTGGDRLDITSYTSSNIDQYISGILKTPTSLNYYGIYNGKAVATEASSYITITGLRNLTSVIVPPSCSSVINFTSTNTRAFNCPSSENLSLDGLDSGSNDVYVSVRVLNGLTPAWTLVNETKQDDLEAFPVIGTYPSLAFTVENATIVNDTTVRGETRQAAHQNCFHNFTSTFQVPLAEIGYNEFILEVQNGTGKYQKIIPFVVTDSIGGRCQNGGSVIGIDAKCNCPPEWSGPDCSRPVCQNGGSLNAMQTACYCDITHNDATCSSSFSFFKQ